VPNDATVRSLHEEGKRRLQELSGEIDPSKGDFRTEALSTENSSDGDVREGKCAVEGMD
jgi:hypothetical protein